MSPKHPRTVAAVAATLTLGVLLSACSTGAPSTDDRPGASSAAGTATTSVEHNDADVEFAQMMILHHQGALDMAVLAEGRAQSEPVQDIAARIQFAQQPEIDLMTSWLETWGEYQRLVNRLVQAGLIEDATKLWWDIRPSARYPTLEMRVTDVCTRLDDGICVAALYVCLLAVLTRLKQKNQRWRIYANTLIDENRWLAQRYGTAGKLVDFGKGEAVPYADLLEELIELTREEAVALGCLAEVERARGILKRGTSAQRQLQVYRDALHAGMDKNAALKAVVDWLVAETVNFTIPE